MGGYAAHAHIAHVEVRPASQPGADRGQPVTSPAGETTPDVPREDLGPSDHLVDDLRTAWAQTTFYLFDPQSWR
jgi:hypothetical protein